MKYPDILLETCRFAPLTEKDIPIIVSAFSDIGWNKPYSVFQAYFEEQVRNERCVWVAWHNDIFLGYVTLKWQSAYKSFKLNHIPEINDLNVLPNYRRKGIGSKLLELAEHEAQKKGQTVGLGVGLDPDYGNAQKLYVQRGYCPDGLGITYKHEAVKWGDMVQVDDDLNLWFVKHLTRQTTDS